MKICFVLPRFTRQPIGGYKMVFEYANRLCNVGYDVNILFLNDDALKQFKIPKMLRRVLANIITHIEPRWFALDKKISKISNFEKGFKKKLENIDVCVATGIQTVETVKENFVTAKKLYFIQGYETWDASAEYVHNTYGYGFTNIVVAEWLKKIVDNYSKTSVHLLKNPIDINIYKVHAALRERKDHTIGLLYHEEPIKGIKYAMQAIYKLKEIYDDLTVEMFGMFPEPKNLPSWIHYKRGATQQETVEIYNSVKVFLCASVEEGYGLTGLEAMACGACLVSTAYKGVLEYAVNGENALLSQVKDVDALVENVCSLFNNPDDMERISANGVFCVKNFSWDEAMKKMERIIDNDI